MTGLIGNFDPMNGDLMKKVAVRKNRGLGMSKAIVMRGGVCSQPGFGYSLPCGNMDS